jgi:hypothetical protein
VVNNYYNLDQVGNLELYYPAPGPDDLKGVEMFVTPFDWTDSIFETYNLTPDNLGPLNGTQEE